MERMDRVLSHFEQEAKRYDEIIIKLIPDYKKMIAILLDFINYDVDDRFSVIDLGCGTGTLSKSIEQRFPNADITCLDISEKMLEIAKNKMNGDVTLINDNFYDFEFPEKYDVIVSSLALHHLESDEDKQRFYEKIHAALNTNGILLNIDIVTSVNEELQKKYMEHWKKFMLENTSKEEVENEWLPDYYVEDRPTSLPVHFSLLKNVGFTQMDCVYKNYNYAVYLAVK